jgi:hypothetical protein
MVYNIYIYKYYILYPVNVKIIEFMFFINPVLGPRQAEAPCERGKVWKELFHPPAPRWKSWENHGTNNVLLMKIEGPRTGIPSNYHHLPVVF